MSSFFRITLYRSKIGMPQRSRDILAALGLHRRMQTVFHRAEPNIAGMLMRVKELVRVAAVDKALSVAEVRAERTPDTGFYVEHAAPRHNLRKVNTYTPPPRVRLPSNKKYPGRLRRN